MRVIRNSRVERAPVVQVRPGEVWRAQRAGAGNGLTMPRARCLADVGNVAGFRLVQRAELNAPDPVGKSAVLVIPHFCAKLAQCRMSFHA